MIDWFDFQTLCAMALPLFMAAPFIVLFSKPYPGGPDRHA